MYTCNYKLFKYFKCNLHQNKLVLFWRKKVIICNVHFKSEIKFKIATHKKLNSEKNHVIIEKMGDVSVHVCGGSEGRIVNDHCAVTRKNKMFSLCI